MMQLVDFWQQHSPIFSILIPAVTAFVLVLLGNPGSGQLQQDWRQPWRRGISFISIVMGLATAISYVLLADSGKITVYQLSEWSAPFGIVLVLDRLAAFMLLLTYILAVPIMWYASKEWDERGRYFHAMCHFLLMGLCGAFLTGDLFNLFVFFEILLMASYVLLLHGQGRPRFQLGIHYVTINLVASALFLIGLGLIYASVGSLNMVDVSRLIPTLSNDQHQLAMTGSLLLFVVFGIKAAILPLGFWLPKTYAVATTPVAALFTIMSKVGLYAILRVNLSVFNDDSTRAVMSMLLLPIGLITAVYGVIGAMGAERLRRFVGFMVLSSVGTIVTALSLMSEAAWTAALYYLIHSTLIAASFYLLSGWITSQRGANKDHFILSPRMKQNTLLSICFFIIALMMAGLPPFSGFFAKVFILQATLHSSHQLLIIMVMLLVSLLSIIAFTRVGLVLFWRATAPEDNPAEATYQQHQNLPDRAPKRNDHAIYIFLILLCAYVLLAHPVLQYLQRTTAQLGNQKAYIHHMLKRDEYGNIISTQPFSSGYLPETKYGGETQDPNAHVIPYVISPATLQGEHISEFKQRQIYQQQQQLDQFGEDAQLKPMEP